MFRTPILGQVPSAILGTIRVQENQIFILFFVILQFFRSGNVPNTCDGNLRQLWGRSADVSPFGFISISINPASRRTMGARTQFVFSSLYVSDTNFAPHPPPPSPSRWSWARAHRAQRLWNGHRSASERRCATWRGKRLVRSFVSARLLVYAS